MSDASLLGGDDDHNWSWSLPFAASSAPKARTHVTVVLRHLGVPAPVVDDACLVVSELLANALRYARPLPQGQLQVGLEVGEDALRLLVIDGGSATVPSLVSSSPMSAGGRGLSIVQRLTRDWGVRESRSGNTVFGVLGLD